MKARLIAAAGLALLGAQPLAAQTPALQCPTPRALGGPLDREGAKNNAAADLCRQGADIFQLMAPQLGVLLTGGNATLGQGGTLGGLGHFSVGVRANVVAGDYPDITRFPTPRTSQNQPAVNLRTRTQPLPLPTVDAAVGLFRGIPLGLTNLFGVDLLVSAAYVPKYEGDEVSIEPESNLKFGFGARVGLLQESLIVPGVSFTYLKRDLPRTSILTTDPDFDIRIGDMDVKTTAWRVVASKSLLFLGVAAGYGQDKYDQSTIVSGRVNNITLGGIPTGESATLAPVTFRQDLTRNNMFVDVSLNLVLVKLVAELGQVTGGQQVVTNNNFVDGDDDPMGVTRARKYGSVGVRIGF